MQRMLSFNKYHFIASALVISLSFSSCNQEKNGSVAVAQLADSSSSTIFISNDKKHEFVVIANPGSTDGKITVHDSKENKEYALQRVDSGSGIKYQGEDGYALWTKGSEFVWSKNDETIAKGSLKTTEVKVEKEVAISKFNSNHYGNFVTGDYDMRGEGNDWVAVIVKPIDRFRVKLSVRSRADKKRETCTFDAIGYVSDENTLKVSENGINIVFTFTDNEVSISTMSEMATDKLAYFCSGGASLADTYSKIDGDLDPKQIDKTGYSKSLEYNNILFLIEEKDGMVTVTPEGLEAGASETYTVTGEIINAEVDDLNNDTFPELLIYTKSGVHNIGEVIGFSVNNGKSLSKINIPKVSDSAETNQGYQGYDEFAMVEGTFIQRFPIYENNEPTEKIRQIQYKLEDAEGIRQLVVNKIMNY
ncbi:MliC family protein [Formosa sp. 4Alg 33]|uniref:MliC family protein n=1 Tax=Formosa sp. 4Alg 33 TaxID=3382189 RepID=UPI003D9C0446